MDAVRPAINGERVPMRDRSREEVDFCIVGAGAGGGTLGAKLAEAGFSVVILDAGPRPWRPASTGTTSSTFAGCCAGTVHLLQADATRCGGISGFLRVAALCEAFGVELSAHTAPLIHLAPAAAVGPLRHVEYFHDHVRIERMLLDGVPELVGGDLRPAWDRPRLGVEFKSRDAEAYRVA